MAPPPRPPVPPIPPAASMHLPAAGTSWQCNCAPFVPLGRLTAANVGFQGSSLLIRVSEFPLFHDHVTSRCVDASLPVCALIRSRALGLPLPLGICMHFAQYLAVITQPWFEEGPFGLSVLLLPS